MKSIRTWLLLLFHLTFRQASSQETMMENNFKTSTTVGYMPGPFLSQKIERSKISCAKSCAQHPKCWSFNFDKTSKMCELSEKATQTGLTSSRKAAVQHMRMPKGRLPFTLSEGCLEAPLNFGTIFLRLFPNIELPLCIWNLLPKHG